MTTKQQSISDEERLQLENICREPGCNNDSARGVVICEACMHGTPTRASDKLIALKKKWTKIWKDEG